MATIVKAVLSGSVNGRLINVSATTTVTVHTATSSTNVIDEVYVYAVNNNSSDVELHLGFAGSSSLVDTIKTTITAKLGPILIAPGLPVLGFSTNLVIQACVTATSSLFITGFVNRITQ